MTKATAEREARLRSFTNQVRHFDPTNPVHLAHFMALKGRFGEMGAAMLVSQDAAYQETYPNMRDGLELTDAGHVETHPGWRKLNRVVRHGEKSRYSIYEFDNDRIVPLFTRDQTVPAYAQPE
jgi:hypothetical protein